MLLNVEEFRLYGNEDDDKEHDVSTKYVESIHWKIAKFRSNSELCYSLPSNCTRPTEEIREIA
jgi:hypothetical protein